LSTSSLPDEAFAFTLGGQAVPHQISLYFTRATMIAQQSWCVFSLGYWLLAIRPAFAFTLLLPNSRFVTRDSHVFAFPNADDFSQLSFSYLHHRRRFNPTTL